jgi:hypothetical protein
MCGALSVMRVDTACGVADVICGQMIFVGLKVSVEMQVRRRFSVTP